MTDPRSFLPLRPADVHILLSLAAGPRHGYGIMKEVELESGGEVRLEIGSLYRLLARLHADGLLEDAPGEDRRRCYRLTRLGHRVLRAEALRLDNLLRLARSRRLLPESEA
ncbi:MAG: PadR family transcriptional regulator [Bryobacteraceae bacterium]